MTYPGILFWVICALAIGSRGPALEYMFFFCWSLGTLAVVPPQMAGGNFTPAWMVAAMLTGKVLFEVGPMRYLTALADLRRFGALTLCTLYAIISAFLLPRLFEGKVDVVEMRLLRTADPQPLAPNVANFTQAMYFVLTTLVIVNVYFICSDPIRRRRFLTAFGWGAVVAMGSGLLDLVASKTGMGGLLQPFRNAAYAMMLDNDAMNMHRIVGLMSEASAYAALCLPFLAFVALTPPDADVPWRRWSGVFAVALTVMTYLSTSSSGYVSLGVVGLVVMVSFAFGIAQHRRWGWQGGYLVLLAATGVVGILLLAPEIASDFWRVLDGMVLHKTQSDSYMERSAWNHAALRAFFATHGLGAGTGAARASSWPIALLANIGVPGTGLLVIFMAQAYLSQPRGQAERALALAAKLALIPNLVMASLSGTSISLGLGVSMLFGLVCALGWSDEAAREPAGRLTERIEQGGGAMAATLIASGRPA